MRPQHTDSGYVERCKNIGGNRLLENTDIKVSAIFTPAEEFIDFDYRDRLIEEGK